MVEVNVILDFPYSVDNQPPVFKMQFPCMPKVGDYIGTKDVVFGPKYNSYWNAIKAKYNIVYGCCPQYVREVGYSNNGITVIVGINPFSYYGIWSMDNVLSISELGYIPKVGDGMYINEKGDFRYITGVTCIFGREKIVELSLGRVNPLDAMYNNNNDMDFGQIVSVLEDIGSKVTDISYAFGTGSSRVSLQSIKYAIEELTDYLKR